MSRHYNLVFVLLLICLPGGSSASEDERVLAELQPVEKLAFPGSVLIGMAAIFIGLPLSRCVPGLR
jgi:hypothetical protein